MNPGAAFLTRLLPNGLVTAPVQAGAPLWMPGGGTQWEAPGDAGGRAGRLQAAADCTEPQEGPARATDGPGPRKGGLMEGLQARGA